LGNKKIIEKIKSLIETMSLLFFIIAPGYCILKSYFCAFYGKSTVGGLLSRFNVFQHSSKLLANYLYIGQ